MLEVSEVCLFFYSELFPEFFRQCWVRFTRFYDFWSQIGVMILVTPKQEVERKKWFWGVKLFRSNFKVVREKDVWTKFRFHAIGFRFTCGIGLRILKFFYFYSIFLNCFPNIFIVHYRSSFFVNSMKNFWILGQDLSCYVFVSYSDALFRFTFVYTAKLKVNFSEWLLPLTYGICARDVISHSLANVFSSFAGLDFDLMWLTPLNKMTIALQNLSLIWLSLRSNDLLCVRSLMKRLLRYEF